MRKVWLLGSDEQGVLGQLQKKMELVSDLIHERRTADQSERWANSLEIEPDSLMPCLLVLDAELARQNSGEILKKLAQNALWASIPRVIVARDVEDEQFCADCYTLGASGYTVFPADEEDFEKASSLFVSYGLQSSLLPEIFSPA